MNKALPLLAAILLLAGAYAYARDAATDVKSTSWGMSKEQVKRTVRKDPITEGQGFVIYQYAVFGAACFVSYNFEQETEELSEVSYIFKPGSKGESDRIYSAMSAYLVKEYRLSGDSGATRYLSSKVLTYENAATSVVLSNNYKTNETVTVVYTDMRKIQKSNIKFGKQEGRAGL